MDDFNSNNQANVEKFLQAMGEYQPPIPDAAVAHILAESGLSTSDTRVSRILNVACQKFISEVLQDCANAARQRVKSESNSDSKRQALDLQMSDLKASLKNKGICIDRPDFIVSIPQKNQEE